MPTEIEVWNLFWLAVLANGVWFAGLAFLIWVSFRAANMVGGTDNMIGKVAVTVFCLTISRPVSAKWPRTIFTQN